MTAVSRLVMRWLFLLAIAGITAGCVPSKAAQCNKLLEKVNKIRPVAEQFQQEGKNFEAAAKAAGAKNDLQGFKTSAAGSARAFNQLAEKMDDIIQEIQAVDLKDETLAQLKDRYVQNATAVNALFKETTTALTTISQIENSPTGLKQLDQAGRSLTATAGKMNSRVQEENQLVSDFNNYCEVKK
ncbi:hypothetical protein OsccyDRAFT_4395 [Leptolyngbyaceae cyanobacterium JSC-12]|nr:hypothetical protein OsccyDRAFT_4395 [Leptolyngbyaceae cyanobacterium JSC-12]